jgi:glycosyltransferase involved in cell wall biosynthesis
VRVAVVHPSGHLFNTPCVPNLAEALARSGIETVVYAVKNSAAPDGSFEGNVVLRNMPLTENRAEERVGLILLVFTVWLVFRLLRDKPEALIASGVRGLFVVGALSYLSQRPFAYSSLEIYPHARYTGILGRFFKRVECRLNGRARFSITQDETRGALMRRENRLGESAVLTFPNAPLPSQTNAPPLQAQQNLRNRLGIAPGSHVLLYAGSLYGSWGGIERFLEIASQLPQNWVLFLQSRMTEDPRRARDLSGNTRIVLSGNPLSTDDYACLVATSSVGLAWYESEDDNIRLVGLSSGKIAQYWAHGKPIIVNRIPCYDEAVPRYHAGRIVDSVQEIPAAVGSISGDYERFSAGARNAFAELFDLEGSGHQIADQLRLVQ